MDKQQIISDGWLEAYLTENLSPEESSEVEEWITKDKEVATTYFQLQKQLELLTFTYGHPVNPGIKRQLMEDPTVLNSLRMAIPKRTGWTLGRAASVAIVLGSALLAIYFGVKWKNTEQELSLIIQQNIQLAENFEQVNHDLGTLKDDLSVMVNPDFERYVLQGTENAPDSKVIIYRNQTDELLLLNSASLADLSQDQQYQLWALVDGKPVDLGVFDAFEGSFQTVAFIATADAFAITIEPAGGSKQPSLETMQVYGEV